jgi:hypothetical protein
MYGGGYIFSGDIARALHLTNKVGGVCSRRRRVRGVAGCTVASCKWWPAGLAGQSVGSLDLSAPSI